MARVGSLLNGLDLFSGIGGLTKALEGYVMPVAYCENNRHAQAVLLSRMADGKIPLAPIWDDIQTLQAYSLPPIDIIYGGFPCQDISEAGTGKGLDGERSGLFFEIVRLASEIRPSFVFLENVSAITYRGLGTVTEEFARLRYDCRWGVLSAADVGANHIRERWWFLAHTDRRGWWSDTSGGHNTDGEDPPRSQANSLLREIRQASRKKDMAHADDIGRRQRRPISSLQKRIDETFGRGWWETEPDMGRMVNGLPCRVDRLRGLGNAVVPAQAREAFERLIGFR